MVVIAIISLLAMVAVPTFSRLIAKAKRTEAYMNLKSLYAAQKAYHAEYGKYSATLYGKDGVGWKPEGYHGGGEQENFVYTYGFSGSEGINFFTGKLKTDSSYLQNAKINDGGFMAIAAADIDNDGEVDIISINQDGVITIIQDDL